jgi:hypothetical protein
MTMLIDAFCDLCQRAGKVKNGKTKKKTEYNDATSERLDLKKCRQL